MVEALEALADHTEVLEALEADVEVVAMVEVVTLPPSKRRTSSDEILIDGVSVSDSGYGRRLDGYSLLAVWRP